MKLEQWRTEIDEIDGEIVALLERRARVAKKIGELKAVAGLPVIDALREESVLRAVGARAAALPAESLKRIYRRILHESRLVQVEAMSSRMASITAAQDAPAEVY